MEQPTSIGTHNGPSGSCERVGSQDDVQNNGLASHAEILNTEFEDVKAFDAAFSQQGSSLKSLSSVERLPTELKYVTKPKNVGSKSHSQGSLSLKQAARQSHKKPDSKQLGKRVGIQSEKVKSDKKKFRVSSSKDLSFDHEKHGSKPPTFVSDNTNNNRKVKAADVKEAGPLKQRVDAVQALNSTEPAVPFRAAPKPWVQDISKEEAAFEFQQCVSLLRKYGVLNTREYYLSQNFPRCAPHPGFVGDKHQSKRCKICGVLEDTTSTVICDECQESFHLSCCLPRLNPKHFDKEDDWYCSSCRKQKRRMGRYSDGAHTDSDPASINFISKVKLGTAYQANVPSWADRIEEKSPEDVFGMEEPLSEEAKEDENFRLLDEFELKAEKWSKQVANNSSNGAPENWLKCHSVLVKGFKDCNGHKHSEILCGKWRRAPLNIQQFERWECFCAIEWDPCHADCAVPQELPTEEILRRMQVRQDLHLSEHQGPFSVDKEKRDLKGG